MKNFSFVLYIVFLLNFGFLSAMDEMQLVKIEQPHENIKPKPTKNVLEVKEFNLNPSIWKYIEEPSNSKSIVGLLKNDLENLNCATSIDNQKYHKTMLTLPFLIKKTHYSVLNLAALEEAFRTFYLAPILQNINKKIQKLNHRLDSLEQENFQLKEQSAQSKKSSLLTGLALFFSSFGLNWLWNHYNLDLSTFFNQVSSVILIKK